MANQRNKLRVYRTFKTEYTYESYLDTITNVKHRMTFTQLRISNHILEIEKGRYRRPYQKPEERICPLCKIEPEDELHFLLRCTAYDEKRHEFLTNLKTAFQMEVFQMSEKELFKTLMSPKRITAPMVAKYVYECYKKFCQHFVLLYTLRPCYAKSP